MQRRLEVFFLEKNKRHRLGDRINLMAGYPTGDKERIIDHRNLFELVKRIFMKCGMASEDAALMGKLLVRADLRGCHSHILGLQPYKSSHLRSVLLPLNQSHNSLKTTGTPNSDKNQ